MLKNVQNKRSHSRTENARVKTTCPHCGYVNFKHARTTSNRYRCLRCHKYV